MASLQQIKQRMKSIESTQKTTNAMQLLASVKLNFWRNRKEENDLYCNETIQIIRSVFLKKKNETPHTIVNEDAQKKLVVIVTSSLGLCGSYNNNIFNYIKDYVEQVDDIIVIGERGYTYLKPRYQNLLTTEFLKLHDHLNFHTIHTLTDTLVKLYPEGEYKSVQVFYTHFINAFTFEPTHLTLFPIRFTQIGEETNLQRIFEEMMIKDQSGGDFIMIPQEEKLLPELTTLYTTTLLYKTLIDSFLCEHASRRNAMDAAKKNADDLIEELTITYNKERQEMITNEINEIISGSEAHSN